MSQIYKTIVARCANSPSDEDDYSAAFSLFLVVPGIFSEQ